MRISWLSADEIAAAREALTAGGKTWDDHFVPRGPTPGVDASEHRRGPPSIDTFVPPPDRFGSIDWPRIAEHVARAERISERVRDAGLTQARVDYGESRVAIEAATLASAAHEGDQLGLDEVLGVLACPIDGYVFYAPFLELAMSLGREERERVIAAYETFVEAYATELADIPHGRDRIAAVRDGLADTYVNVGRLEDAQVLFERRHEEDQQDVAVALTASRAFLAAGATSQGIRWLGIGASRAHALGREELAAKLRDKQAAFRRRLS